MSRTKHHGRARLNRNADGTVTLTVDALASIAARAEEPGLRGLARAHRTARRTLRRARKMAERGDARRAARLAGRVAKGGA